MKLIHALAVWLLLTAVTCYALPPIASEYYGILRTESNSSPAGTVVIARWQGIECGRFTSGNPGYYGLLSCKGDDPGTAAVDGSPPMGNVSFYLLNGSPLRIQGDTTWTSAAYIWVNLSTPPVCGDFYCDTIFGESCRTCPFDCGLCGNFTGNQTAGNLTNETGNVTNPNLHVNLTNGTGGQAGAGGQGGGQTGAGATGQVTGGAAGGQAAGQAAGAAGGGGGGGGAVSKPCTEKWQCTNYLPEVCPPSGVQLRNCTDLNRCRTQRNKPNETQPCVYLNDTCANGAQDYDEEGVDCGGRCKPCPSKLVNAFVKPPQISMPAFLSCGRNFPLLFFIMMLVLAGLLLPVSNRYQAHAEAHQLRRRAPIEKLKHAVRVRHTALWLVILITALNITVTLYNYFYLGCPSYRATHLLMLIAVPLASSIALWRFLKTFEYDDERKRKKLAELESVHQERTLRLLRLQQDNVISIEEGVCSSLSRFEQTAFADDKAMDAYSAVSGTYPLLLAISLDRKQGKSTVEAEQNLGKLIDDIQQNPQLSLAFVNYPELEQINRQLNSLKAQYEASSRLRKELEQEVAV